tara:strand:- start:116 stop:715 length:600 start_codon:yes stop_codon:yes gene_type:complete
MSDESIDDKDLNVLLNDIAKVSIGKKKRTKLFAFKLVELFLHNDKIKKSKIKNAKSNFSKWDPNGIQCILLKALEKSFDACLEIHKIKKPFDVSQDYISVKYLEAIFDGYFEDKKDLEKEIEELEDKLDGNGMVPKTEYNDKCNILEEQIDLQAKHIKKLEKQLAEREEYYKLKIAGADERAEERLKFNNKVIEYDSTA